MGLGEISDRSGESDAEATQKRSPTGFTTVGATSGGYRSAIEGRRRGGWVVEAVKLHWFFRKRRSAVSPGRRISGKKPSSAGRVGSGRDLIGRPQGLS